MRGLSLLEVMLSCLLLSLSIFFTLTVFTGILRASTQADSRSQVVATLEVLGDYFRHRTRANWSPTVTLPTYGEFDGYLYSVTDLGLVDDPLEPTNPGKIDLRLLELEIRFYVHDAQGHDTLHTEKSLVSVPR